jgi:uncharacterized protein YbjT (DUF2867 family)
MKLLVSGGTGLLGQALLGVLRETGVEVRCLARPTSRVERLGDAEVVYGDCKDVGSMAEALRGVDAFIHVAGIEHAPRVIEAMRRAGVGRLVIVSSTSAHSRFESRSSPRTTMEALVRESGLAWTVMRPAMIYGSELDKNIHKLLRFLDRYPAFPMFGPGTNLWQPVFHQDLAHGVHEALVRDHTVHQTYDLPGAEPLTYEELVRTAAAALGKKRRIVKLPIEPVRLALSTAERLKVPLPVKSDQVLRLREDKAYSYDKARAEIGYAPRTFQEGVILEVARLREVGLLRGS